MSILTAVDLTRKVGELKADLSAPPSVTLDNDRKPILVVCNLSKAFGKVTAVGAINFEVFEGEIFGLVGITATAPTYSSAIALANRIKQSNNDSKVVLSGPQATFLDRDSLERSAADAVVRGEGEHTMLDIADSVESGGTCDFDGATYREADTVIRNPDRKLIADLDDIPVPARDLPPMEKYSPPKSTGVISSRGCPFRCIFCASSNMYHKTFRALSAHNVFEEVAQLVAQGYENVTMLDNNFILNEERAFEFADLVEEHHLKFDWSCTGRVESIDVDLLGRLREVGFNGLFFGIESAPNETLKLIKKGFTTDQVIDAFDVLKKYKYATTASFVIRLPGDDRQKILDTINLAKRINPDFAMFSVTTPYPGTELYENIDHYDIELTINDWSQFTLENLSYAQAPFRRRISSGGLSKRTPAPICALPSWHEPSQRTGGASC